MSVVHVSTAADFKAQVAQQGKLVIADFSAAWCGPCKKIAPVYEKLAKENPDVVFLHCDVDELEDLPDAQVRGVPTFKFFKNGAVVEEFAGANEAKLVETLKKFK